MADTTGFDVNEKVNILFKTAMGFPSTKESTNWFQETGVPYNTYVFGSDILTDDIPANPTYGAAKTEASVGLTASDFDTGGFVKDSADGKVRYYHRLILDQCIANNSDSWHKTNSSGNNVLMDALQFNVNKTASITPYGYTLTNKANVAADNTAPNEILQNAAGGNWFFDINSGIVFFPDNSTPSLGVVDNSTKKPVFSFYKYIGNKGLSTWSGGGGGGGSSTLGGLTDVSTSGASSGQAIVYNGSSWAPGNVASSGGGGTGQSSDGVLDGQVLETLAGVCDGRSIAVASGTYTLENPITSQVFQSATYASLLGSKINYKPPVGTKQVVYTLNIHHRGNGQTGTARSFWCGMLVIDGVEYTASKFVENKMQSGQNVGDHGCVNVTFVISIGDVTTDDVVNGKLASWDTLKTIEMKVMTPDTGDATVFYGTFANVNLFIPPRLQIQAIGRGKSGVALAGTNMSYVNFPDFVSFTLNHSYAEINGLRLNITPEYTDSVIEVKYIVYIECSSYTRDMGAIITRTVGGVETDIKNITGGTDRWDLLGRPVGDDAYNGGSPWLLTIDYYDTPNTTSAVTYKIKLVSANANTTRTVYINRPVGNEGASAYLVCMSTASAIEHPKPNKALNPITSATQVDGQVLETLAGICDGSTVKVSSGSYTLENVTLKQTMQDTYLAVSGSSVNYKPPSGTNKIVYNFYTIIRPKQTAGAVRIGFEYRLYVDGTEISSYNAGIYDNYSGGGGPSSEFKPSFVLTIGEKDDVVNGHFLSWDSNKVVEIRARSYDGSNDTDDGVTFHEYWWRAVSSGSAGTSGPVTFVKPRLEITAIGKADYDVVQRVVTYKDGQVLETLEGLCDGRTVIGASGTYTLPNVIAAQDLTETYTDLTGSLINYKPPSGTKIVVYSLKVQANVGGGTYWNCGYQLYIDDVAFGVINLKGTAQYNSQEEVIEIRIYITGTDDYANCNIASWESLKTIKLKCRERNSGNQSKMHHADVYAAEVGAPGGLAKPTMKITAIGRQVAPASAADFKIQKVDTISTLPNNGNMLTWDEAKGRWKPSEFIIEGDDGSKLISDINLYTGYTITDSEDFADLRAEKAFDDTYKNTYEGYSAWGSPNGRWNTSTGAYTHAGSTSTNIGTLSGAWLQIDFGKKAKIYHVVLTQGVPRSPRIYYIAGSNDNTNWTVVLSKTNTDIATNSGNLSAADLTLLQSQWNYHPTLLDTFSSQLNTLSSPATYRYFRLIVTHTYSSTDVHGQMQMQLHSLKYYGNFPNERIQTLPVVGTNLVHKRITNTAKYQNIMGPVVPADTVANATELTELEITIKPEYSDSVIHVEWNIWFEANENNVFRIVRFVNGVSTVFSNDDTTGESGYAVSKYDTDAVSTPNQIIMDFYDEPNTTAEVTYKVYISYIYTSAAVQKFVLNRVYDDTLHATDAPSQAGEKVVSTVKATEHPKPNTAVLSSVNNSTAVEGQVLETLSGMCDGRSISVASGNYTLQDVTSTILVTGSNSTAGQPNDPWIDLTGSTINYTPPVGTKQVIYEFDYAHCATDTNYVGALHNHRILLDGVKIEQSQRSHRTAGASMYEVAHERVMCIIDIVEEDDITNNKVKSWRTSKEIKIQVGSYSSTYKALMHSIQHGRGQYYGLAPENGGAHNDDVGHLRKPNIKITAVGTQQYDVVQRVVTYKDGQVLETLAGVCDGRSVTVASGTYTLENVTTGQVNSTTDAIFRKLNGSEISYKPPVGTKQVSFKFYFHVKLSNDGNSSYQFNIKFLIDGNIYSASHDVMDMRGSYSEGWHEYTVILSIGDVGTDDIANGKLASWDTLKTLKLEYCDNNDARKNVFHETTTWVDDNGNWTHDNVFVVPRLEIQAIGRAVEPASAADFKIQRVNTLSSEPDNGSVLLYDSGKKEWTASGTRTEDQDIRLLSDPAVHVGHEHLASSIHNDSDEYYEPHHAFNYTQSSYYNSIWASSVGTYATTGAYAGSTTTEGYNGEWIQINLKRKAKIYYYGVMAEKTLYVKRCPKSWRLYGSNNGNSWTQLDEQEDRLFDNWWSKNQSSEWPSGTTSQHPTVMWGMNLQKIELSQPATYQYFRMVINEKNSDAHNKVHLNFLGFYGVWNTISATTSVQSGVNLSYVNFKDAESVTVGNTSHTEIQGLRLSITPEYNDSVVELNYVVMLENAGNYNGTRDMGAVLTRTVNGVETIFRSNGGTDRWDTLQPTSGYDGYSHHMHMMSIKYYDEPNTTLPITYKIKLINTGLGTNQLVYINRTATTDGGSAAETSISVASAKELPKPQAILSTVSNSTALEGQVLETLTGICDGRSIVVASGTYTLENVTAKQVIATTTYIKATGSGISYKPPPGTKQIIISFATMIKARQSDWDPLLTAVAKIDGSLTNHFQTFRPQGNSGTYGELYKDFTFIIDIGSVASDDIANGKLASWNVLKDIEIHMKTYNTGGNSAEIHAAWHNGNLGDVNGFFTPPRLTITAIGTTYHSAVPRIVTKKSGQLLETIAGMCDGRSITSASGTYTLENITQGTLLSSLSGNFIDFPGSSINYKPPSGVKQVFYTFQFTTGRKAADTSLGFKFFIDGAEATIFKKYYGTNGDYGSGLHTIHFVIDIGSVSSDDIANGKLATWNTSKTIKVQAGVESDGYETWINKTFYDIQQGQANANNADTSHNASTYVRKPLLKIEAFGESGTAAGGVITETGGNVGIGTDSPSTLLVVGEDGGGNATNTPGIHMKSTAPIGAGNNLCYCVGQDSTHHVYLTYYALSDVADGYAALSTYGGSNSLCLQHAGGNVGIGTTSIASYKKLVVYQTGTSHGIYSEGSATQTNHAFASRNSSGNDSWAIRYNGTTAISSDDRLKHNEKYITNALDVIKKIQPVKYFKTAKMFDENFNFEIDISGNPITSEDYHIESGLIAQEVKNIKELQYCVGGGETDISGNKQPYNLNYNDIFVYNIAATQELDRQQQADKAEIAELKTKNTELENKVNELENKVNTVYNKNALLEAEIMMIKNKIGM